MQVKLSSNVRFSNFSEFPIHFQRIAIVKFERPVGGSNDLQSILCGLSYTRDRISSLKKMIWDFNLSFLVHAKYSRSFWTASGSESCTSFTLSKSDTFGGQGSLGRTELRSLFHLLSYSFRCDIQNVVCRNAPEVDCWFNIIPCFFATENNRALVFVVPVVKPNPVTKFSRQKFFNVIGLHYRRYPEVNRILS